MFIHSNSYQLRTTNKDIFTALHNDEFPVSHVRILDSKVVFSSRNEVFMIKDDGFAKKLTSMDSDVSVLTVSGAFVCVGSTSGGIKILADFQNCIRSYAEHTAAVNDIKVVPMGLSSEDTVVSCSDDSTIRLYKLLEENSSMTIRQEGSYINAIDFIDGFLVAASERLEVYSAETGRSIFTHSIGQRVSHVCALSSTRLVFAANNAVALVDTRTGVAESRVAHTRAIESLQVYNGILYTVSCDGHFKSFTLGLKLLNDFNLRERITDFHIADDRPVISLMTGAILGVAEKKQAPEKAFTPVRRAGYEDDIEYETLETGKKRLSEVEGLLRRFEYKACLKLAMEKNDPDVSYSVLQHLREARALKKVLSDEGTEFVEDFLVFCTDYIQMQEFKPIVVECLIIMTSIYSEMIVGSETLRELLDMLCSMLYDEIQFQETCLRAVSFLDSFKNKS